MFALMVISLMTSSHNFAQERRVRDCGTMSNEKQESNDKYQIPIIVFERRSGKCSITYIPSYSSM